MINELTKSLRTPQKCSVAQISVIWLPSQSPKFTFNFPKQFYLPAHICRWFRFPWACLPQLNTFHLHRYHTTVPILSVCHAGIPRAPIVPCRTAKYGRALWQMNQAAARRSRELSCCSSLPCGWLWQGPKHWNELDVEKNGPGVWVWFLSSLILTVAVQCVSQAGILSAGLNVMIFIRTCPRLLYVSYRIWHHCPRYRAVFTYD